MLKAVSQVMREDGRDEQSYTKVTGVVSNAARGGPDKVVGVSFLKNLSSGCE